jgi:hypothetical protein
LQNLNKKHGLQIKTNEQEEMTRPNNQTKKRYDITCLFMVFKKLQQGGKKM